MVWVFTASACCEANLGRKTLHSWPHTSPKQTATNRVAYENVLTTVKGGLNQYCNSKSHRPNECNMKQLDCQASVFELKWKQILRRKIGKATDLDFRSDKHLGLVFTQAQFGAKNRTITTAAKIPQNKNTF
eukprot:6331623-Amphidinium_carterae.1